MCAVVVVGVAAAGVAVAEADDLAAGAWCVVLNHASSEKVCGPGCQYGETACTVEVLVVPGKFDGGVGLG